MSSGRLRGMEIDEVADALYVLPPEAFTVARGTAASLDPSRKKAITALRRPTVAAWIVNTLVRKDPLALEELLALGPALAEAQSSGDGAEVRALSQQRRALLPEVASRAVELAGRAVSDAVLLEVESTLDAGLVDPASADAVRSGRLVRALSFAGFGGVDLAGATAVPVSPTTGRATADKATGDDNATATKGPSAAERKARAGLELLEADALDAAGRLDDAVRAFDTARETADRAAADLTVADAAVARAEEALAQARQRRTAVQDREREATSARTAAERAVSRAQARAEKARLALDARRRG
jgi:hypothetical protein